MSFVRKLLRTGGLSWRLTFFYTATLVLALAGLGLYLDHELQQFAIGQLATRLIARNVPPPNAIFRNPGSGPPPPPQPPRDLLVTLATTALETDPSDEVTTVLGRDGTAVKPPNAGAAWQPQPVLSPPLFNAAMTQAQPGNPTAVGGPSGRLLVYYRPILLQSGGPPIGVFQVSTSLAAVDDLVRSFRIALGLAVLVITAIAVAIGRPLASLALVPLRHLTAGIAEVSPATSTQPLPVPESQDEVSELANAFNLMLRRTNQALDAERRVQGQIQRFVADASHEIRSPLTSLSGFIDLLLEPEDVVDTRKIAPGMRRIANRINRLVEDLFMLTRLDSTVNQPAKTELIDLTGVASDVLEGLALTADQRTLSLEEPPDGAVWAEGDRYAIERVLENLVRNAIQYTDPTGTITISVRNTGSESELAVIDNGEGIPAEDLDLIFNRFYRVDAARSRGTGNAGLGLSIVQAIVTQHHGRVTVESKIGRGSTFRVFLPSVEGPCLEGKD